MAHSRFRLILLFACLLPTQPTHAELLTFGIAIGLAAMHVTTTLIDPFVKAGVNYVFASPAKPQPTAVSSAAGTTVNTMGGAVTINHNAPITNIAQSSTAPTAPAPAAQLTYYHPSWKGTALAAYLAVQTRLIYLTSYLSGRGLPSSLFSSYTLDELLLSPPDKVQQALHEYLFDTYTITNQHELKLGIARFLGEIDAEVSAITEYRRYCAWGATLGGAHRYVNSQLTWVLNNTIPLIGPLLGRIPLPTIDQFFFLKQQLANDLPERLSKVIFLKTVFLQTPFTV